MQTQSSQHVFLCAIMNCIHGCDANQLCNFCATNIVIKTLKLKSLTLMMTPAEQDPWLQALLSASNDFKHKITLLAAFHSLVQGAMMSHTAQQEHLPGLSCEPWICASVSSILMILQHSTWFP